MPLELGTALSIEREPVNDPEIRTQVLEAIYLILLQVNLKKFTLFSLKLFYLLCYILDLKTKWFPLICPYGHYTLKQ